MIHADLARLRRHCGGPHRAILCMGDTLTHLASVDAVEQLFDQVVEALAPDGVFVATFRDYSDPSRRGVDRFIPVRQDDRRMLTCVLELAETAVVVHDLVHEHTTAGWTLRVSSYPKLRVAPEWARTALGRRGLTVRLDAGANGMARLVATRPA